MKKRVICFLLSGIMLLTPNTMAFATSRSQIQSEINEAEDDLAEAQDRIDDLSAQQAAISAQISDVNAELVDMMISIQTTELAIADTENNIAETQAQIEITTEELAVAEADKQEQYDSMKTRIRYIYENGGDAAWFKMILEVNDIATMLNRAEYAQSMHDYDRKMLAEFAAVVEQVKDLKASLEAEKASLEEYKTMLEVQKASLEAQKAELQIKLASLEAENADYQAMIEEARAQASAISDLIAEQQAELERIAEEEARRAREEEERRQQQAQQAQQNQNNGSSGSSSSSGGSSSGSTSSAPSYTGNGSGASIVAYARQFVGNPYVYGGKDLYNGIDCSNFVHQVLTNCGVYSGGYRVSWDWAYAGRPVANLAEAQAGDVIVLPGHVGILDENGLLVEAKGSAWGITNDRAPNPSKIIAIRRFV